MEIDIIAKTKNKDEFYKKYKKSDNKKLFYGTSLIFYSIMNNDLDTRYEISNFLLDEGVDVKMQDEEGNTVLHILLAREEHDIIETTKLCKRFLDLGVDINVLDNKNRLAFQWVLNMKYTDIELEPLYNLFLSYKNVDFTTKNAWGFSPLDLANKLPYRNIIVNKIKEYIKNQGE